MTYSDDVLALNPALRRKPRAATSRAMSKSDRAPDVIAQAQQLALSVDPALAADGALVAGLTLNHPWQNRLIDLAHVPTCTAVEINGGRWQVGGGSHASSDDRAKVRSLQIAGWIVLEYLTEDLTRDPVGLIREVAMVIRQRMGR